MAKDRKIDMVILGLLVHENLSGYDIKKRIDNSISFFWKGSFGSIYPSLTSMEKDGYIKRIESNDNKSGRAKNLYGITPSGKSLLTTWLKDTKATNDFKYETLLKVFFGNAINPDFTIKTIEEFEREIRTNLGILKMYRENLSKALDNKDHVYYYITVSFGITTYEGYLKWCEESLRMLRQLN